MARNSWFWRPNTQIVPMFAFTTVFFARRQISERMTHTKGDVTKRGLEFKNGTNGSACVKAMFIAITIIVSSLYGQLRSGSSLSPLFPGAYLFEN